jgi:ABC-type transport system substrate-binding protein
VRVRSERSGQLDIAEVHEPAVEARAEQLGGATGSLQVLTDNSGETTELVIALQSSIPPFNASPARQAVAFGVDREAVSRRIFSGAYPQAYGPYSEGAPWYGQAPWPGWDAGKARQSAQDYTRESGKPLRFTMLFPSDPLYASLGQLLVDEFEAAGLGVTLEILSASEVRSRVESGDYEAAVLPLFGGGHPDEDFGLIYGKTVSLVPGSVGPNYARFRDDVVDEAIDKSRAVGDIGKQADQFQKIQEVLAKEAPYVFLVHLQGSMIATKNVQGLTKWHLPDGSLGISQLKTTVALNETWIGAPPPPN